MSDKEQEKRSKTSDYLDSNQTATASNDIPTTKPSKKKSQKRSNSHESQEEERVPVATEVPERQLGKYTLLVESLVSEQSHESLFALQELSEVLSIATEEMFLRQSLGLSPLAITKNILAILDNKNLGDLGPDQMLMACRCLYNLIDAFPSCTNVILQLKGINSLVEKLMEIEYIDMAEQVMKVLERLSKEYPLSILKANGLLATLQYIDFFGIHVQRVAVTIVSNCLNSLPIFDGETGREVFLLISGVLDNIVRLMQYPDQKIADLSTLAVFKIVQWVPSENLANLLSMEHLGTITSVLRETFVNTPDSSKFNILLKVLGEILKSPSLKRTLFNDYRIMELLKQFMETEKVGSHDHHLSVLDLLVEILPRLPVLGLWKVSTKADAAEEISVDNESLQEFLVNIFPILPKLFMNYSKTQIRKKIVLCLCRFVWYFEDGEVLGRVLKDCSLGKVIFDLLHYHVSFKDEEPHTEELILILGGLSLTKIFSEKCHSVFMGVGAREGIPGELSMLCEVYPELMPMDSDDLGEDISRLFGEGPATIEKVMAETSALSANHARLNRIKNALFKSSRTLYNGYTSERFLEKDLIVKVTTLSHELQSLLVDESAESGIGSNASTLKQLQERVKVLGTANPCGDEQITGIEENIKAIFKIIVGSTIGESHGLTGFELFSSNLVEFFVDFLIGGDQVHQTQFERSFVWTTPLEKRLKMFCEQAFEGDCHVVLTLIQHLSEHLARNEDYAILTSLPNDIFSSGLNRTFQLLQQITRQIKISLTFEGDDISFATCQISIPAIGSFKTLESFVMSRISPNESPTRETLIQVIEDFSEDEFDEDMMEEIDEANFGSSSNVIDVCSSPRKEGAEENVTPKGKKPQAANIEKSLVFYVNGKRVETDETMFKVFYQTLGEPKDCASVWTTVHQVTFKREPYENKTQRELAQVDGCRCDICSTVFVDLHTKYLESHSAQFRSPLVLLSILRLLNDNLVNLVDTPGNKLPSNTFINNKICSKISKQMSDPLLTISNIYPNWAKSILAEHEYMLPFDLRLKYFKSSGLGHFRNLTNYLLHFNVTQTSERSLTSLRSERMKIRISRENIFQVMVKVLNLCKGTVALEFEFRDEAGSGLGPTLEFFALVSQAIRDQNGLRLTLSQKLLKVWRNGEVDNSGFLNCNVGLYPRPLSGEDSMTAVGIFEALGQFVARSILDSRQLDVSFNPLFLKQVFHRQSVDKYRKLYWLKHVDKQLHDSLLALKKAHQNGEDIEAMMLDHTLPGYPEFEFSKPNQGANVTAANLCEYVEAVIDATIGTGVQNQIEAFQRGFNKIIPLEFFEAFGVDEVDTIISGQQNENWKPEELREAFLADHGFNPSSRTFKEVLEMLCSFTSAEKRDFLAFCTGSPKLPIGGFKALNPKLTIVRKAVADPDLCLPSVMTCAHYLKVPEYSTYEILRSRFLQAITEGQNSFHLS